MTMRKTLSTHSSSKEEWSGSYRDPIFTEQLFSEDYSKYTNIPTEDDKPKSVTINQTPPVTENQFHQSTRALNYFIRNEYANTIHKVGRNVFPLIIAIENETNNTGVGGTYILFTEDGKVEYIRPVSHEYEFLKTISHIPLGIFSIIGPYLKRKDNTSWIEPLKESVYILLL